MSSELCGDGPLSAGQRLSYLFRNLARNLRGNGKVALRPRSFRAARLQRTPRTASPGRALTEAFLYRHLPAVLPVRRVRVLEIGCGSGNLTRILSEIGYSGEYVGVDINDRFDRSVQSAFERTFVHSDIHRLEPGQAFDLIVSVSVLEHIPEDRRLTERLGEFLTPSGVQLHFVPSGWGLGVYLWHGYRQYTRSVLADRFDPETTVSFGLGGGASFLLHFFFITVGEILLRLRIRQRLPRLYGSLLDRCLRLDQFMPVCSTMYAICQAPVRSERVNC